MEIMIIKKGEPRGEVALFDIQNRTLNSKENIEKIKFKVFPSLVIERVGWKPRRAHRSETAPPRR
jgi:hypothetical protein